MDEGGEGERGGLFAQSVKLGVAAEGVGDLGAFLPQLHVVHRVLGRHALQNRDQRTAKGNSRGVFACWGLHTLLSRSSCVASRSET